MRTTALLVIFWMVGHAALADGVTYDGRLTECSASCETLGALALSDSDGAGTRLAVWVFLNNDDEDFAYDGSEIKSMGVWFHNRDVPSRAPVFGPNAGCAEPNIDNQLCNPAEANPWVLNTDLVSVTGSGSADAAGTITDGVLTMTLLGEPFVRNDAQLVVDLISGEAELSLLGGAVVVARFSGVARVERASAMSGDSDGDGIGDDFDNCLSLVDSSLRDTNRDGFGNRCDADINNDCAVNSIDLGLFRGNYFTQWQDIDFNGDGIPAIVDLGILRTLFFMPPGPSTFASCD